ncbi:MAG: hypothetical protein DYH13_05615 [Alphaproteobacteria bacterium PRO2]|nr:hypothetical protein [Alphaproteobacteria bacterium PRO2]
MKLASKKIQSNSSARVVDGKLILTYPDAVTPVVWQMDLTQAKASALEVRESPKGVSLVLKTAKGETVEIAPFATKGEAVEALMAAAKALEGAHGQIRPAAAANSADNVSGASVKKHNRWAAGLLGVLLIVVLLMIWASLAPRPAISVDGASTASPGQSGFEQREENGVPLSADEFLLKNRAP